MTFRLWFTKEISIRLTDENTGFISTVRYGKIHLKREAVGMRRVKDAFEDCELRKAKDESHEA